MSIRHNYLTISSHFCCFQIFYLTVHTPARRFGMQVPLQPIRKQILSSKYDKLIDRHKPNIVGDTKKADAEKRRNENFDIQPDKNEQIGGSQMEGDYSGSSVKIVEQEESDLVNISGSPSDDTSAVTYIGSNNLRSIAQQSMQVWK